jgi:hypothetical protein
MMYGVPQGSILGSMLFLTYINDLPQASDFLAIMYASDTTLLAESNDISELYKLTNKLLADAEKWFLANRMTLHPSKTRYMLFSHSDPGDRELNSLGQKIIRVHEKGNEQYFKLVGILLDEKLTWKYHIDKVKTKIAQSTALICRSKRYLPKAVKILLYKALVVSHLEYCVEIWGGATKSLTSKLFSTQNKN